VVTSVVESWAAFLATEIQENSEVAQSSRAATIKDSSKESNAEGVRQFQPRVELWQPWDKEAPVSPPNPEGVH